MDVTYRHCAGLDVHKKSVVACVLVSAEGQRKHKEVRTFGTMTADLLRLSDWLTSHAVTHVAMESTGEFWKPVYNILEGNFELLVANAKHIKNVPGRKTDVKDAEWIAELLRHGLLRGSFIPEQDQRNLRDLTRQRTNLVEDRTRVVNRVQKVCEWSNIKLSAVVSDITGVSARAMLAALIEGQLQPEAMAALARGKLRDKRDELTLALTGVVHDHHRFLWVQLLTQLDFLDEQIAVFDREIAARLVQMDAQQPPASPASSDTATEAAGEGAAGEGAAGEGAASEGQSALSRLTWTEAVALVDTIPGISPTNAESLLAETGIDMSRFPTAAHFASWAKLCPGNNESGGKKHPASIGHGNRNLRAGIVQAAWAAIRVKDSYLAAVYHRLVTRRGAKRSIVAVAHHMLTSIYHMLRKREPFHDLGATYFDQRNEARVVRRNVKSLEKLGYRVAIERQLSNAA
jgi:transposase